MNYCFGVDIGGTTVKIGLFEETGTIVEKWEIPTNTLADGEAILPDIAFSLKTKIEERKLSEEDILGIGVGVPAPVTAEGIVNGSANLGWKYKEVKKEMEELTGLKAYIGNDANVAALGEMWKGGGAGEKATATQRRSGAKKRQRRGRQRRRTTATQKNRDSTEDRNQRKRRDPAQRTGTGRPAAAKNPGLGKKFRPKSLSLFPYG